MGLVSPIQVYAHQIPRQQEAIPQCAPQVILINARTGIVRSRRLLVLLSWSIWVAQEVLLSNVLLEFASYLAFNVLQ